MFKAFGLFVRPLKDDLDFFFPSSWAVVAWDGGRSEKAFFFMP